MKLKPDLKNSTAYYQKTKDWNVYKDSSEYHMNFLLFFKFPFTANRFQYDSFIRNSLFIRIYLILITICHAFLGSISGNLLNLSTCFAVIILIAVFVLIHLKVNNCIIRCLYLIPEFLLINALYCLLYEKYLEIFFISIYTNTILDGIVYCNYRYYNGL